MRESEDRIEFKAGEGGNVSYDGRGKTNPKDRRRCILGYVIALCNEGGGRLVIGMHDNYPHRVTGIRQAQNGYKLSDRYYEIAKNAGTVGNTQKYDTVNVPENDTVNLSQLTERQRKIYEIIKNGTINDTINVPINDMINAQTLSEALGASVTTIKRDLYVLRDLNIIKYVGSNKTGHWEVIIE